MYIIIEYIIEYLNSENNMFMVVVDKPYSAHKNAYLPLCLHKVLIFLTCG